MLTKKIQKLTNPPTIPPRATLTSVSRGQIIEVKDSDGNVVSTEKKVINLVVPQPEHSLVSDEPSSFYDVVNLQAHGIDLTQNQPYYMPSLDDMSENQVSNLIKEKE